MTTHVLLCEVVHRATRLLEFARSRSLTLQSLRSSRTCEGFSGEGRWLVLSRRFSRFAISWLDAMRTLDKLEDDGREMTCAEVEMTIVIAAWILDFFTQSRLPFCFIGNRGNAQCGRSPAADLRNHIHVVSLVEPKGQMVELMLNVELFVAYILRLPEPGRANQVCTRTRAQIIEVVVCRQGTALPHFLRAHAVKISQSWAGGRACCKQRSKMPSCTGEKTSNPSPPPSAEERTPRCVQTAIPTYQPTEIQNLRRQESKLDVAEPTPKQDLPRVR